MQTINTIENVREQFPELTKPVGDQRLSRYMLAARHTLRVWVGTEKFEAAMIAAPCFDEHEPGDFPCARSLKEAESNLSMYHLILHTTGSQERQLYWDKAAELAKPYRNKEEVIF